MVGFRCIEKMRGKKFKGDIGLWAGKVLVMLNITYMYFLGGSFLDVWFQFDLD